jgi:spermidine synthase
MGKRLFFPIFALGFSSLVVQLLLIREFLNVFVGNELVIGIILANWLALTGVGSWLAGSIRPNNKLRVLVALQVAVGILPIIQIFFVRALRAIAFGSGTMVGLGGILASSIAIMLPYCFVNGYFLVLASQLVRGRGSMAIGRAYMLDSIGALVGGSLFSFVLVFLLNPFHTAFLVLLVNLVAIFFVRQLKRGYLLIILFVALLGFYAGGKLDKASIGLLFPGQEILYMHDSRYGKIVVTNTSGQFNFFENSVFLYNTNDTISAERVHYAMAQSASPKRVLVISGWLPEISVELLKYNISRVDYIELDPLLLSVEKLPVADSRIATMSGDARLSLKRQSSPYDVIIVNLPDPESSQLNRFYTLEFFEEAKKALSRGGIIMTSISSSEEYISPETQRLNAALYATLHRVFANVIIIPGDRNIFLASDAELTYDIAGRLAEKGIQTKYVNRYYLESVLTKDRIDYVGSLVKVKAPLNTDLNPVAYGYYSSYWLSHFGLNLALILVVILMLVGLYLTQIRPVQFALFATGFSASAMELVIIIAFQMMYGYAYYQLGIVVTLFMAGVALGSRHFNRAFGRKTKRMFLLTEAGMVLYPAILALALPGISILTSQILPIVFPFLGLVLGFLTGAQFPLASQLSFESVASTAARLYSADLIGACIGAFVVSVVLIPQLGIVTVCLLVGGIKIISGVVVWKAKNAVRH